VSHKPAILKSVVIFQSYRQLMGMCLDSGHGHFHIFTNSLFTDYPTTTKILTASLNKHLTNIIIQTAVEAS